MHTESRQCKHYKSAATAQHGLFGQLFARPDEGHLHTDPTHRASPARSARSPGVRCRQVLWLLGDHESCQLSSNAQGQASQDCQLQCSADDQQTPAEASDLSTSSQPPPQHTDALEHQSLDSLLEQACGQQDQESAAAPQAVCLGEACIAVLPTGSLIGDQRRCQTCIRPLARHPCPCIPLRTVQYTTVCHDVTASSRADYLSTAGRVCDQHDHLWGLGVKLLQSARE